MEQKRKNLLEMHKVGFSQKTLSLMTESQIDMILEKIKKKETKEAITKTVYQPTKNPDDLKAVQGMIAKTNPNASIELDETKKKKKKYNPFAVCTASVGRKNKKKYEDCVMGVKEKIKEGRNPYEYLIESKMEEIVENNLSPKMTKGELLRIIAEKKMMMKKPIGKMMSMKGETMEGDTKTKEKEKVTTQPKIKPPHPGKKPSDAPAPAKAMMMKRETMENETQEKTKEKEKTTTTPKTRPGSPNRNPNPDIKQAPAKAEQKKEEIINAITKLIGKGK